MQSENVLPSGAEKSTMKIIHRFRVQLKPYSIMILAIFLCSGIMTNATLIPNLYEAHLRPSLHEAPEAPTDTGLVKMRDGLLYDELYNHARVGNRPTPAPSVPLPPPDIVMSMSLSLSMSMSMWYTLSPTVSPSPSYYYDSKKKKSSKSDKCKKDPKSKDKGKKGKGKGKDKSKKKKSKKGKGKGKGEAECPEEPTEGKTKFKKK